MPHKLPKGERQKADPWSATLMTQERSPAHAGTFYPDHPDALSSLVNMYLNEPDTREAEDLDPALIRALIVPHGEYMRSGTVAAQAFRLLKKREKAPERVVIVAPLHYWPEYGVILPTYPSFGIPTGSLPVDRKALQKLAFYSETLFSDEAHQFEHSIETQLPFLMSLWGPVPIVPIGFADIPADVLAHILEPYFLDPETVILFSADFSRYFSAQMAMSIDRESFWKILSRETVDPLRVCGATGLNALAILARKNGLSPRLLSSIISEIVTGDPSQTIGFASFGFS